LDRLTTTLVANARWLFWLRGINSH
jgi:hypothetical protein